MKKETRTCQNCKARFTIEPEDFMFYAKMRVPPPTWCPECRAQRRLVFRNERNLYKRKESLHGEELISMYASDSPVNVYTQKEYFSDVWDPIDYGREYDFSRPFLTQLKELISVMPWPALINWNGVNSGYCNYTTDNKNCYLVFGGDFNENCAYATFGFHSQDSMDLYWVNKVEKSYQCIDSENCYEVAFARYARGCRNSFFLFDCANCDHCIGCTGLKNRSYCIFNKQYSKEDYEKVLQELKLESFSGLQQTYRKFEETKLERPHRFAEIVKAVNSTGNNIHSAKKCTSCFDAYEDIEDSKDIFIGMNGVKDSLSCSHIGHKAELAYDSFSIFSGASNVAFSGVVQSSHHIQYSLTVSNNSSNLFGCVGLKNKSYCILNKQYTKEEYEALVPKIIEHMNTMPYTDPHGRIYRYGEFFPPELSPFAYNETIAQEYFPLTKEQAVQKGYRWRDPESKNYMITMQLQDLPDHIKDVSDTILDAVIQCQTNSDALRGRSPDPQASGCTTAFKIIPQELEFYRQQNIPLPRLCPNCRHAERIRQRNPMKLWHRPCQCSGIQSDNGIYQNQAVHIHGSSHCPNQFETSYAPDRPEIVYCEGCYQGEVV